MAEGKRTSVTWAKTQEGKTYVVGKLLSVDQLLSRERPYVKNIPLARPNHRFLVSSPARKPSFFDVTRPVGEMSRPLVVLRKDRPESRAAKKKKSKRRRTPQTPQVLYSVIYEERLRDIVHRMTRTTYERKAKGPALLLPWEIYTCCPLKI